MHLWLKGSFPFFTNKNVNNNQFQIRHLVRIFHDTAEPDKKPDSLPT